MSRLSIETQDPVKPILLFLGDNLFVENLIDKYAHEAKIAYISDKTAVTSSDFYRIKRTSVNLIGSLEEKIDYAVLYIDKNDQSLLPAIFEKLTRDETKTLVLIDIKKIEEFYDIVLNYKTSELVKFVFVGDIYSEKEEYSDSEIAKILRKAVNEKVVNLSGDDLSPLFPIYLTDAINGVGQLLFATGKKSQFFYLFYNHPQTLISAVHIISRIEPDLEVKYRDVPSVIKEEKSFDEIEQEIKGKLATKPLFLDKYFAGFEKSIPLFAGVTKTKEKQKSEEDKTPVVPKKVLPKKQHVNVFSRALGVALVLFVIFNFLFIGISMLQLRTATQAFEKNEYDKVAGNIEVAKFLLEASRPTIELLARGIGAIGIKQVEASFDKAKNGIDLLSLASRDLNTLQDITQGLDYETLDRLLADATYIYFRAEEARQDLQTESLNTIIAPDLSKMISIAQIVPDLLGYRGEKNYLVLFQNNGELRPTGGFIGSVGEAKFTGGRLESFNIQDVYEYDGQLKAHVEPHYIIRRYLQPHLYLRDSNFHPDFQDSAATAAQLFELETGRKVDGVIALNFEAVRALIKEIGPLELTAYNKTLNEENAFEFLQTTIDDNFFPGSSAKKDVLQALFNQITLKLEEDKSSFIKVARLIPKLMNQKDIMFAFNTNSVQSVFAANGYGGELSENTSGAIKDYLYVSEANIGVNKANVKVLRETAYTATIDGENINSEAIHTLFNENTDMDYRAYIRFLVPRDSSLESITIDNVEQNIAAAIEDFRLYERNGFTPPSGLEVDNNILKNKQSFGFITTVKAGTRQEIKITYSNGIKVPSNDTIAYSLLLQKQPGVGEYPFTFNLNYTGFTIKEVENASLRENGVSISEAVTRDEEFVIELIKS